MKINNITTTIFNRSFLNFRCEPRHFFEHQAEEINNLLEWRNCLI